MEAGKLYNLIIDIRESNLNDEINKDILILSSSILNRNDDILLLEKKLFKLFDDSIVNSLVPSDKEILNKIGGTNYFGNEGKLEVLKILGNRSYDIQQITENLDKFAAEREKFLEKIRELSSLLEFFKIEIFYPSDQFHIGLLLPSKFTHDNKIKDVSRELNKWDKIIKNIKELVGEDVEDTKIEYVSNGSLDFFFENSAQVALFVSSAFSNIVTIYDKIAKIRQKRIELKELGINSGEDKNTAKQEKDLLNSEIDKAALELIKHFAVSKMEGGRKNELSIAINGHLKYFAKYIDSGVIVEINPPQIDEPDKIDSNDTDIKKKEKQTELDKYKELSKKIDIIKKSMETVNVVQRVGLDLVKSLNWNESNECNDSE